MKIKVLSTIFFVFLIIGAIIFGINLTEKINIVTNLLQINISDSEVEQTFLFAYNYQNRILKSRVDSDADFNGKKLTEVTNELIIDFANIHFQNKTIIQISIYGKNYNEAADVLTNLYKKLELTFGEAKQRIEIQSNIYSSTSDLLNKYLFFTEECGIDKDIFAKKTENEILQIIANSI